MFAINWTNLEFYQYLVIGGVVLAVLAVVIHFFLPRIKLPASVAAAVGSLALGFGGGALTMAIWGYRSNLPATAEGTSVPLPGVEKWLLGGGVLAVLALTLCFLPVSRLKLPASVAAALGSLVLGFSSGLLLMTRLGYCWDQPSGPNEPPPRMTEMVTHPTPEMMERMKQWAKGGGIPGQRGNQAPSPKVQLAVLIERLDLLTRKDLQLGPEQKKQVLAQLQGLGEKDQLSEDEAKGRLDALLDILKKDQDKLAAAGDHKAGTLTEESKAAATAANPFKAGEHQQHLKALQERLTRQLNAEVKSQKSE